MGTKVQIYDLGITTRGVLSIASIKRNFSAILMLPVVIGLPLEWAFEDGMTDENSGGIVLDIAFVPRHCIQVRILTEHHWRRSYTGLWQLELIDK